MTIDPKNLPPREIHIDDPEFRALLEKRFAPGPVPEDMELDEARQIVAEEAAKQANRPDK